MNNQPRNDMNNKVEIFNSYEDFLSRDDLACNGVSIDFAAKHKNYSDCYDCTGCWNCYDCTRCTRCTDCTDCSECDSCTDCTECYRCYNCTDCTDCTECYRCYNCTDCYDCTECYRCDRCTDCYCTDCYCTEYAEKITIPRIPHIHAKVFAAVKSDSNNLKMSYWHTCETTHCRAGWVVHLAGKAGYDLEQETDTEFAAKMIYKHSSDIAVSVLRFFDSDEEAIADIERCAKLEEERI